MVTAEEIIRMLHLEPLDREGGMFLQTYKSAELIEGAALPERYRRVPHSFCTAIYYLLTDEPDSFSALHQLPTDEIYHFYLGDPVEMLLLYPDGQTRKVLFGHDILHGQRVQFVAPEGAWQGSHLLSGGKFALLGTTMAPGYEDNDFSIGKRDDLIGMYPGETELIRSMTRE